MNEKDQAEVLNVIKTETPIGKMKFIPVSTIDLGTHTIQSGIALHQGQTKVFYKEDEKGSGKPGDIQIYDIPHAITVITAIQNALYKAFMTMAENDQVDFSEIAKIQGHDI